jgi:TonB family protein
LQDLRISRPLGLGLDEQAIAAVAQWRFAAGRRQPQSVTFPIDFVLPSKQSRWHLVGAEFKTPAGASRPIFAAADYPLGPGIGVVAYDEAQILAVIGRAASATVSFDIDEGGYPGNFLVVNSSAKEWGPEAAMVIQSWRFHPGMRAGTPVSVSCTLSLVWGPEDFTSKAIAGQMTLLYPPPRYDDSPPQAVPLAQSAIVSKTEPEYTEEARRAGIEGSVWLSLTVNEQGTPVSVRVDGPSLGMGLEANAMEAVKQWRFQPALLNGQPAAVALAVRVEFRLSGVESFVSTPTAAPKPAPLRRQ